MSLQQLGLLLRQGFAPWLGNIHMLCVMPEKKKMDIGMPELFLCKFPVCQLKIIKVGVPFMAQWLMNPTRIHEDAGSIPGLPQ